MESYQRLFDIILLGNLRMQVEHWVLTEVLVRRTLVQVAALAGVLLVSHLAVRRLWPGRRQTGTSAWRTFRSALVEEATPILAIPLVLLLIFGFRIAGLPAYLLLIALQLLAAWVAIKLLSKAIRSEFWARLAFGAAFSLSALAILGLLEPLIVRLDRIGVQVGSTHVSALDLLRGLIEMSLFIWVALILARIAENYVQNAKDIAPSLRVLTGKLLRIVLVAIAFLFALTSIGIDITTFALVSGALGVALGFGMQKTISNLISGLLLLIDRSIKPGDVLELTDPADRSVQLFGWVTALNARYVSLTTRDGTEWLLPNEELISQRIVNWSYSHHRLRLLTPISISFDCDVELAMQIAVDAARETRRVLADPPPVCRLMSFGDSSAELELRFWIEDPTNGIINVRSDVLVAVWRNFRENGIRTRYGHRELHIKRDAELTVRTDPETSSDRA